MAFTRSKGTKLKMKVGETYELIGQVDDVSRDRDGDTIETTNHDTTALDRTYMAGLRSRTVSCAYFVDGSDANQTAVETAFTGGTVAEFEVESPDGERRQFDAVVTSLSDPAPIDGAMRRECELQVSGAETDPT